MRTSNSTSDRACQPPGDCGSRTPSPLPGAEEYINNTKYMIESYIHYYNTRRVQRNLGVLTPMEKHKRYLAA